MSQHVEFAPPLIPSYGGSTSATAGSTSSAIDPEGEEATFRFLLAEAQKVADEELSLQFIERLQLADANETELIDEGPQTSTLQLVEAHQRRILRQTTTSTQNDSEGEEVFWDTPELEEEEEQRERAREPTPTPVEPTSYQCGICFGDFYFEINGAELNEEISLGEPMPCGHNFCDDCLGTHVGNKVHESDNCFPVVCPEPGCTTEIDDARAERVLNPQQCDEWFFKKALSSVTESIYCPNNHCGGQLEIAMDEFGENSSAECPYCHILICVRCKVPYHAEITCEAYQALPPDERSASDRYVMNLANNQGWQRCKSCGMLVERTAGCRHMSCRCGYHFCYRCGGEWDQSGYVCKNKCA